MNITRYAQRNESLPNPMLKRTKKAPLARMRRAKKPRLHPPTISLPNGGTRSVALVRSLQPILSPARVPLRCRSRLARVAYDSGNGNGPFGIGWTDKGLPQYRDAEESGRLYLLRGRGYGAGLQKEPRRQRGSRHTWKSDLRRRVAQWPFGQTLPAPRRGTVRPHRTLDNPSYIFSWLICQSYDDKDNAIVYEYAAENDDHADFSHVNERNRVRSANRYSSVCQR